MLVVDTSAWIEWLTGSPVGAAVKVKLPPTPDWVVPTIVQFELAKWLSRELGQRATDRVIAFSQTCIVIPLDARLALRAARASTHQKLAAADAIVYATAQACDATLLTCDSHFDGLLGVMFVSKRTL